MPPSLFRAAERAVGSGGAVLLSSGQLSTAVLVPPDSVVRFPRHELGVGHLRTERAVVGHLADHLSAVVELPLPRGADLDAPPGAAFAVHRFVRGDVVDRDLVEGLDVAGFASLVDALSAFLAALSTAPVADALPVPHTSVRAIAEGLRAELHELLANRLTLRGRTRAERELDAMAGVDEGARRAWCHGDLGGNLIWEAASRRLGVIDWGTACVSDPVLDLASVLAASERLAAAVAERTPHLRDRLGAARAVQGTFVLQDLLYGARQGDDAYVADLASTYE